MTAAVLPWANRVLAALRAQVSNGFSLLALVGVPAAVIATSGGLHTIPFWIQAVIWIPVAMFSVWPVGLAVLLIAAPLIFLLEKMFPRRIDAITEKLVVYLWVALTAAAYVTNVDLGNTSGIRLPTPWPNLGALVVLVGASGVSIGLLFIGGRLEVPKHRSSGYMHPPTIPDIRPKPEQRPEPDPEFWSHQPVIGWRSWTWNGSSLRGVWESWPTPEFTASCDSCIEVPGWNHSCGIYAMKDPSHVFRFAHVQPVVG